MGTPDDEETHFVNHLVESRNDRGIMAALRRGLGRTPGTVTAMYPYVIPWVKREAEARHFLVASLFAAGPKHCRAETKGPSYSVGWAMRHALDPDKKVAEASMERRFLALLDSDSDELPQRLARILPFLNKKEGTYLDYVQLLGDLRKWESPYRTVQKKWALDFWTTSGNSRDQSQKKMQQGEEKE